MPKSFTVPGQAAFDALLAKKAPDTEVAAGRCGTCSGRCAGKSAARRSKH